MPVLWNCFSMRGSTARVTVYIDRTFRFMLKSQSFGSQSRIVPWCTKPAQLNRICSGGRPPTSFATAASSSTSSLRVVMPGLPARLSSSFSFTSVA